MICVTVYSCRGQIQDPTVLGSAKQGRAELNVDICWLLVLYTAHCYPKLVSHIFF